MFLLALEILNIDAETSLVATGSAIRPSSGGFGAIVAIRGFVFGWSPGGFDWVVVCGGGGGGGVLSRPWKTWETVLDACESLLAS